MAERPEPGRGRHRSRTARSTPAGSSIIRTHRLSLVPMSLEVMEAILAGDWPAPSRLVMCPMPEERGRESWGWLRHHIQEAKHDPSSTAWGPRLLLRQPDESTDSAVTIVGEAGFHGPPDPEGQVEIGYMVVAEYRRQGIALEAARALVKRASAQPGVTELTASVDPRNAPSINLLHKLGFTEVGRYLHDERGEQLWFHCRTSLG